MKDFGRHEAREDRILEDVNAVISYMGGMLLSGRTERVADRSFVLYLLFSIFTLGIFSIYLIYTLIRDPNYHFREQSRIIDELLNRMKLLSI